MKGLLPSCCKAIGYTILICCIFIPIISFALGYINNQNLIFIKALIKLFVWAALFMIFLAKAKNENEETSRIRIKSILYALFFIFIYYIIMIVRGTLSNNLEEADSSIIILYMAFNVACLEFGIQKNKIDKLFKK